MTYTVLYTVRDDGWGEVRRVVWARDRACVFSSYARLPAGVPRWTGEHTCRGKWGGSLVDWSRPREDDGELDHVKEERALSKKPPDDTAHLVLTCSGLNQRVPSHPEREHERAILAAYYPDVWASWIERNAGT